MQISRLLEIVIILLNKNNVTAKELSGHFGVSTRTIYRDIDTLSLSGVPVYSTKGYGGGISLMQEYTLNKAMLTSNERNEILFGLQGLKSVNYPDISVIVSKLNALFKSNTDSSWIEVDFTEWGSGEEDKIKFAEIKNAILNKYAIVFDYYTSSSTMNKRSVEPLRLMFKGQAWYMLGYCMYKKSYRTFRLSRIKHLEITGNRFDRNVGDMEYTPSDENKFDGRESEMLNIRLLFSSEMVFRVFDDFSEKHIKYNENGSIEVNVSFLPGEWVYGYILSYGKHVEVLEPEFLRHEIIKRINEMAGIYRGNKL